MAMRTAAIAVTLLAVGTASAQQITGGGVGGTGSGIGRGSGGGSSATGGGSSSNLLTAGITGDTLLGGFSSSGSRGARSNNISPTNAFYQYFGNPYAAGLPNNPVVGGFGTPIANLTGGSTGGSSFGSGTGGFNSSSRTQGATGGFGSSMSRSSTSGGGSGSSFSAGGANLGFTGGSGSSFGSGSASPFGTGGNFGGAGGNFGAGNNRTGTMNRGNLGATGGTANTAAGMTGRNAGMQNFAPQAATGLRPGILYSTTPRFAAARPTLVQVRTDVEGLLVNSGRFASAGGMRVDLDGPVVVLRGRVADDDERRLAENMARLSPGVREVRNELEIRP